MKNIRIKDSSSKKLKILPIEYIKNPEIIFEKVRNDKKNLILAMIKS